MSRTLLCMLLVHLALACGDDTSDGAGGNGGAGAGDTGGAGAGPLGGFGGGPAGGQGGVGGGQGGVGEGPIFDCALAPSMPVSTQTIPGARGYHGLAVDQVGLISGLDSSYNLVQSTHDGTWSPFLSNLQAEQIAFAADGNLFMAASNGILAVTPSAQVLTVSTLSDSPYGLRIGPDEMIYTTSIAEVLRVDPASGADEPVATLPKSVGFAYVHSFDWSPSFDRIYVGTIGSGLFVADLDPSYNALAPLEQLTPFSDSWIDGVAVDACGNIYAANYSTSQLFKITPDGVPTVYVDWSSTFEQYGHGVIFGNGVGGFREDALYLPQPYNDHTVLEVVVGVPSRSFGGTVVNGPSE